MYTIVGGIFMFDKNKFAKIIKDISETYNNQREFAAKSKINRTYLSQYMNMKLDEPPKPKILEKIANASNNTISYNELMLICGYYKSTDEDFYNEFLKTPDDFSNYIEGLPTHIIHQIKRIVQILLIDDIDVSHINTIIDAELCSYKIPLKFKKNTKKAIQYLYNFNLQLATDEKFQYNIPTDDLLRKIGAVPLSDIETTPIPILRNHQSRL